MGGVGAGAGSAYCFGVTVHQLIAELCPFENFSKNFCSQVTLPTVYIKLKLDL